VERVTGIGGVFLRARDPEALAGWYEANLGLELEP
jgi:glyoxylase I family protein